jgi:hypothetical protein
MPKASVDILRPAARMCRTVALGLISGVWRKLGHDEIETRIAARPQNEQRLIFGATLGALALLSFLFAQFGLIGMLVFLLLVIVVVN